MTLHLGAPLDQAGSQNAFQGPHQAAFITFKIFIQRLPAKAGVILVGIEKDYGRQGGFTGLKRQKSGLSGDRNAESGVGCAKVEAAGVMHGDPGDKAKEGGGGILPENDCAGVCCRQLGLALGAHGFDEIVIVMG